MRGKQTKDVKLPETEDEVSILDPDYSLKRAVGLTVNLEELFSPEVVKKAQTVVDDESKNFLAWAQQDLAALEQSFRSLSVNLENGQEALAALRRAAFTIKSQAGTFGYDLASMLARSLYTFCDRHFRFEEQQCVVLRKHIDALTLIFARNIVSTGGAIGQELMQEMERLIAKFKK